MRESPVRSFFPTLVIPLLTYIFILSSVLSLFCVGVYVVHSHRTFASPEVVKGIRIRSG